MYAIRYDELAGYLAGDKDFILELGEQTGIGSSSLIIRKCGKTILVDRGIAFEGSGLKKVTTFPVGNNLEDIRIDLMIFTHVHADHIMLIVPTVLAHPESRVVFSEKTLEELRIILDDSLKIQFREIDKAILLGLKPPKPMFLEEDAYLFLNRAETGHYTIVNTDEDDIWITWEDWPDWKFGFTFSGHTKGAFISFIKAPDGDGIVATGDACSHDQETTTGITTVSESFLEMGKFRECKSIIVITEATNGNRDREESQDKMDNRLRAVLSKTAGRGGMALFPVFAVNRGPNIVVKLVRLGFKVIVAGMVRKTIKAEIDPSILATWLTDGTVVLLENGPLYQSRLESAARGDYGFRPIITSSATLDQGASVNFALYMLHIPQNVLISTGHRFEGSAMQEVFRIKEQPVIKGRTIILDTVEKMQSVKRVINIRADVHHFDYTAHSYREGLVTLITDLNPDLVFVKHCTQEGFEGLESALHDKLGESCPPVNWARHLHMFEF